MKAINKYCPRSGKPVQSDSLVAYRGVIVGFCNTGCRDSFAKDIDACPDDKNYFDTLIKENEIETTHTQ